MLRQDTHPTVSIRKQAGKYRDLPDYLTDAALDLRLSPRKLRRLRRAVRFNRRCRQEGFEAAKAAQRPARKPAETLGIVGACLGLPERIPLNTPAKLAYFKTGCTKTAEIDATAPAVDRSFSGDRISNPVKVDRANRAARLADNKRFGIIYK